MKAIELVETRRGRQCCETTPRYDVVLFGRRFDQLWFNLRGFVGTLPVPEFGDNGDLHAVIRLTIGEKSIAAYRREVGKLNREWSAFVKANPEVIASFKGGA